MAPSLFSEIVTRVSLLRPSVESHVLACTNEELYRRQDRDCQAFVLPLLSIPDYLLRLKSYLHVARFAFLRDEGDKTSKVNRLGQYRNSRIDACARWWSQWGADNGLELCCSSSMNYSPFVLRQEEVRRGGGCLRDKLN